MNPRILVALLPLLIAGEPVKKEVAKPTNLYASSLAYRECLAKLTAEGWTRIDYLKHPGPETQLKMTLAVAARKEADRVGLVLSLVEGVAVEVSENLGACAVPDSDKATPKLARVRVAGGKDAGTVGCLVEAMLRDPAAF